MKFLPLLWAGLWRNRSRAVLMLLQIVSAFLLFGLLQGLSSGVKQAIAKTHKDRLIVGSSVSLGDPLPISLLSRIQSIPGVKAVSPLTQFPGQYRLPGQTIPITAVDVGAFFIGIVMGSGAVFGALNSLYASVDARRREIGTLRAIGFSNAPIILSVLLEGVVLALPSALVGAVVAWFAFNGNAVDVQGLVFKLAVTPRLVVDGIIWALAIGLIGASLPALRAARMPVVTALRAV